MQKTVGVLQNLLLPNLVARELDGIPCYFSDFEQVRAGWSQDAKQLLFHLEANAQELARQFERPGMPRSTRERIKAFRRASLEQRESLKRIVAALEPDKIPMPAFFEHFTGQANKAPTLLEHFANLHRDWSWGGAENSASLEAITSLLPPGYTLGKLLVPGAGACRLAYDLHQQLKPEATIATEVNPLLFLCAKRILSGGTLNLYEFASLPVDSASYAVKRELRAPSGPVKGDFQLVLNDLGVPCFNPGAFDTIVTSWFIDVVPLDIRGLFPILNALLKPGGLWINLGPTMYSAPLPRFYSSEETMEAVAECGFSCETQFQRYFPHLHSPASAHHRVERLLGFRARKERSVPMPAGRPTESWGEVPDWFMDRSLPVDLKVDLKTMAMMHRAAAETLDGVDGERTLAQLAEHLATKLNLPGNFTQEFTRNTLLSVIEWAQSNPTGTRD
jgi:N2227-like protein